ncbi:pyridoxine 4-dehydrogenase [Methylococcales bacterium]|nr:pyridoxine 4-dehydrogenase [Methylococcales bacterium]
MRYKLLGKSGLRVSELCLGTMTFGEDWGWGASKEESRHIFDAFVNAGGNFIDTASNYTKGTAEKFVGEFVASQRDAFVVATKYTLRRPGSDFKDLNAGGNHRKNMARTVEQSLKRLNTDYIDLLYLHMWDRTTPVEEVLRAFDDLIRAGKVLYVGISDTPAWIVSYAQAIAELRGWNRLLAYQAEYSLNERGAEQDVLPMTHAMDMTLLAFGLLGGGTLTGKFNQPGGPGEATRVKDVEARAKSIAATVMQIANEIGRTSSQVAINWVRQQAPNIIPILGARREPQIQDNLGVLEFVLSDDQLKRLSDTNPLPQLYPHTFWNDFVRRDLIFGENVDSLNF